MPLSFQSIVSSTVRESKLSSFFIFTYIYKFTTSTTTTYPDQYIFLLSYIPLSLSIETLRKFSDMEAAKGYTQDGTVDLRGRPVIASKTGKWKACAFLVGKHLIRLCVCVCSVLKYFLILFGRCSRKS